MQNRWFHLPSLHSPGHGEERRVGWLELFYDLIYVATIIQLGNALAHEVTVVGFLKFAGLFTPIWLTWTGFTFYSNRFVVDDFVHRSLVFAQMFGIGALALSVDQVFTTGEPLQFAGAYGGVRLILTLLYARAWLQLDQAREMTRRYTIGFGAGAVLWIVSAFLPSPWVFLVWGVALIIDIATPLTRQARDLTERYPPDVLHMSERYGLLTIIVLGESFVKVLTVLAGQGGPTLANAGMSGLTLLVTCSIWWIYFDDVAGSRIRGKPKLAPFVWVYAHLPMTMAITAVGVATKKAVLMSPGMPGPDAYRWLLCAPLALALLSVALIDSVTERRQSEMSDRTRVNMRIFSAILVLLLASAGARMPGWAFLALIATACLVQVLFDLSMAPLAADPHAAHHEGQGAFELTDERRREEEERAEVRRTQRRDVAEAVRKGTPNELRRDLYFHFMEGSWLRVFGALVLSFVLLNVIFAALYLLEPDGISDMRDQSFLDAFAFSVQTMTTIGYGSMYPESGYAHILVTVESLLGLLGVALATGLMFAKASRPESCVVFSNVCIITEHDGKRVFSFRAGNARGNDVVEATMSVVILRDEVTPEGHRMRRMHDMKLRRSVSPLFALTWTLFHDIDEDSPLYDVTAERATDEVALVVATMTGHDATYAQTTHARYIWYPEDLRYDEDFVDVISHLDDGRLMLDYDRFHITRKRTDSIKDSTADTDG